MSICYVISKLGIGGAEKNLALLAQHLPKDRYQPLVVCLNGEGPYAERMRAAGLEVQSLGFPHPRWIWRLFKLMFGRRIDLFHGFMFHGNLISRLLAAILRKPAVCAVRVTEGEKRWHLRLDRLTAFLADIFTVNSRALGHFLGRQLSLPDKKIAFIPNALSDEDQAEVPTDRRASCHRLGVPTEGVLLAMIGRLERQKDPATFVRAAAKITAEMDEAHYLMVGVGPLHDELRDAVREAGLGDRFRMLGYVPDPRMIYTACHIFVLPSLWEGTPNTALEAMAARRAVILSDFDGASEIVDQGLTGMIFHRGDDRALAGAALSLARDESLRKSMGERARAVVLERHTVDQMISGNTALYERMAEKTK